MDCYGKYYYQDGLIYVNRSDSFIPSGERVFYEVIRTYGGVPFFFDDHFKRIAQGISNYYNVPDNLRATIITGIYALMQSELVPEINVKLTVAFTGNTHTVHICYVNSFYPSDEMYTEGVKVILLEAERSEPGIKLLNTTLRQAVDDELKKNDAYEALLVNRDGFITEGSRSNVFFLTDREIVFTAPDSMVLGGITRKYLLEICREKKIKVVFDPVSVNNLSGFKAAFITGTSPMVLPVKSIDTYNYIPGISVIGNLRNHLHAVAEESVKQFLLE